MLLSSALRTLLAVLAASSLALVTASASNDAADSGGGTSGLAARRFDGGGWRGMRGCYHRGRMIVNYARGFFGRIFRRNGITELE